MEQGSDDYKFKLRELDYKTMALKKDRLLEIIKIITTGIVVTLIPAIINYQIQQQEVEIARLKGEIEYLDKFSDSVVKQDDLLKRRNFVEYLATIAHSDKSRERWHSYLGLVDILVQEQEKFDKQITAKEIEAKKIEENLKELQKQIDEAKVNQNGELTKLVDRLSLANAELKTIESEILIEASKKENLIKKSRLSNTDIDSDTQIQSLVLQMNSSDRATRLNAVAKLIENHKSNPLAIASSLDYLKLPQIDTLTASGRINVLVFLRNTSPTSWDDEQIKRVLDAIALIRNREAEGGIPVGPQTEDALVRLESFVEKI